METKSEKRWKLIHVTDLDIIYVGGSPDTITFTAQDVVNEEADQISIYIRNDAGTVVERMVCLHRNMLSYKFHDRVMKVEDKSPIPELVSTSEAGDEPTN